MNELIILAGLSATEQSSLSKIVESQIRKGIELRFFPVSRKTPSYNVDALEEFLRAIANTVSSCYPNYLRLIYIPYTNSTELVDAFFPFADIQSLFPKPEMNSFYRTYFSYEQCLESVVEIIRRGLIQGKLPGKKHFSLLPAENFHLGNKQLGLCLKNCYVYDLLKEEDLESSIKTNSDAFCYEDSRGLVFPVSKKPEGSLGYSPYKMTAKYFLSSYYRLGRFWGAGFHHDVASSTKATLKGVELDCSVCGPTPGRNATHANIYLNDYIRLEYPNS